MSTSEDRTQHVGDAATRLRLMGGAAKELRAEGRSNSEIAKIMGTSENFVRNLIRDNGEINWSFNCLTSDVHHGRPETIWNIPLHYAATKLYRRDVLQELVISRIYNDAMMYVEASPFVQKDTGATTSFNEEWADLVKKFAEERYLNILQLKIGELSKYYASPGWALEQQETARRVTENKLNPNYAPLHPHDSINQLCRMIGMGAVTRAAKGD